MKGWQKLAGISVVVSLFLSLQLVFYLHLQLNHAKQEVSRLRNKGHEENEGQGEQGLKNEELSGGNGSKPRQRKTVDPEVHNELKGFLMLEQRQEQKAAEHERKDVMNKIAQKEQELQQLKQEAEEINQTDSEQKQKAEKFDQEDKGSHAHVNKKPKIGSKLKGEQMDIFSKKFSDLLAKRENKMKEMEDDQSKFNAEEGNHTFTLPPRPRYEGDVRIAIIIPYVGNSLPVWFDAFAESCRQSAGIADWLIFHDETLVTVTTPPNVKLINLGSSGLATAFSKIVEPQADQKKFAAILPRLLKSYAYMMVEFKPAYGFMFEDYILDYSHWAMADLDLINGNLTGWIDENELRDYDIFTFSFGDQFRAYARGQLTIHRNIARVNHIWHGCSFMPKIYYRVKSKQFHYQSGEGCYSSKIAEDPHIRMKYSVKVFSDVGKMTDTQKEVLYRNGDVMRCPPNLIGGFLSGHEEPPTYYDFPIQVGNGPLIPADHDKSSRCMFWVSPSYQHDICLKDINGLWNLFLDNNTFYKQEYVNRIETPCWNGAFFHFQDWKSNYRYWSTRPPPPGYSGLLMTGNGFVPLPPENLRQKLLQGDPAQMWAQSVEAQNHTHLYCPSFEEKKNIKCKQYIRWDYTTIIQDALRPANEGARDATLALVGDLDFLENFVMNAKEWGLSRPKILLVHKQLSKGDGSIQETRTKALKAIEDATAGWENSLVALIVAPTEYELHAVTLNMAKDRCRTRFFLALPQHLVLSKGAWEEIHAAIDRWEEPGVSSWIGVIPQWTTSSACVTPSSALSLPLDMDELLDMIEEENAWPYLTKAPHEGDSSLKCTGLRPNCSSVLQALDPEVFLDWQHATEVNFEDYKISWAPWITPNISFEEMDVQIASPSILVDLWSYRGSNWVRYIEEFGAFGCGGTLYPWTLQTLGFKFFLIPKVFTVLNVASTPSENSLLSCNCFKNEEKRRNILHKARFYFRRTKDVNTIIFDNI